MSCLRQKVLPFVGEPKKTNDDTSENDFKDAIKEIKRRIKVEKKKRYENKIMKKSDYVLPEEGYLYPQDIDVKSKKELQRTIRIIKGNKEMKFVPPEIYMLYDELVKMKNDEKKTKIKCGDDLKLIGDTIKLSKEWPMNSKRVRVAFHNVGGICCSDNLYEGHIFNQDFMNIQSDINCFTELNVNMNNIEIKNDVRNIFKFGDKHSKVFIAAQPEKQITHHGYLPGGNVMAIRGTLSGRIINGEGDSYGRWTSATIKCKNSGDLMIVSAYRPLGNLKGDTTISSQQHRAFLRDNRSNPRDVRKIFMDDLKVLINNNNEKNISTLILMDGNTDVESSEIKELCRQTGLYVVKPTNIETLPKTHERGSKCIDFALASLEMEEVITASGFLPFYSVGMSDHRAIYIDLDYKQLFRGMKDDSMMRPLGKFTTRKRKPLEKYIYELKTSLRKAKMFEKMEILQSDFEKFDNTKTDLIKRLNKYDKTRMEMMKRAQKRCNPRYGLKHWSPKLAQAGKRLREMRKKINSIDKSDPFYEDIVKDYEEARNNWSKINHKHIDLRTKHLEDLAEEYSNKHGGSEESALKHIINSERTREAHKKHKCIFKEPRRQLSSVLVRDEEDNTKWKEVTDEDVVYDLLLKVSRDKLKSSTKRCPFMREPFLSDMGLCADGQLADSIIDGEEIVFPIFEDIESEHINDVKTLLKNFQRPWKDGSRVEDMEWHYGADEYIKTFSKISETKTVGPSGLTMHHWKAITYDNELATLFAKFVEIPFKYGITLERWKNVTHIMLPKKNRPFINKLRNIQITEGDYNGALKFIIGRQLRCYGDSNNASSDDTYGGRNKKNCHQMLKMIQLKNEYSRLRFEPQAYLDVDAVGCFDNIATNMIGLAIRKAGGSKELARAQINSLIQQQHRVKTALGLSSKYFEWNDDCKLGGSGQGSGASMFNWHHINETLIKTYLEIMNNKFESDNVSLTVKSFVDDNKLMYAFEGETPLNNINNIVKTGLLLWNKLLRLTGGELSIEKCFFSIIRFKMDYYGNVRHQPLDKEETKINVDIHHQNFNIHQVSPTKGNRLLGVRISGTGNFSDEYGYRLQQSSEMAYKMRKAKLNRQEAYLVYITRYKPMVHYPLSITTFTKTQCKKIQTPFLNVLIPQLGLNRKTPRAVCFGPKIFGGLSLKNIEYDQVVRHIMLMRKHINNDDHIGKEYIKNLKQYQNFIGCEKLFLYCNPNKYKYKPLATTNSMTYIWEKIWEYDIEIEIDIDVNQGRATLDAAIMDAVIERQSQMNGEDYRITDNQIRVTNIGRLYNCIKWVSEMRTDDGSFKDELYRSFKKNNRDKTYPHIQECSVYIKKVFRETICCSLRVGNKVNETIMVPIHTPDRYTLIPNIEKKLNLVSSISLLHPTLREVIGQIETNERIEYNLIQQLEDGKLLQAWTDGSLCEGKIGHGYIIRSSDKYDEEMIKGKARSLKGSFLTSLRPEHCGALAVVTLIYILESKIETRYDYNGRVEIFIDNSAVVNRLNMKDYNDESTDSDIWKATLTIMNKCKTIFDVKHVKSHQDEIVGPLSWEQFYNVEVDLLARDGTYIEQGEDNHTMIGYNLEIKLKGNRLTAKFADAIYDHIAGEVMKKYIQTKCGWNDNVFFSVDWESFVEYFRGIHITKIANIIKLLFDWQYTKIWETRINDNKKERNYNDDGIITETNNECEECPTGCGRREKHLHYLSCEVVNKTKISRNMRMSLLRWMRGVRTDPRLILLINRVVGNMSRGCCEQIDPTRWDDEGIRSLIKEQNEIGWLNFFRGRISKRFSVIQGNYYDEIRRRIDGTGIGKLSKQYKGQWWSRELIRQMIFYSLNLWQIRNEFAHVGNEDKEKIREKKKINDKVMEWYNRMNEFTNETRYLFRVPLIERCMRNTRMNEAWLRTVSLEYERLNETVSG